MARIHFGPRRKPGIRPKPKKTGEPSIESAREIAERLKNNAPVGNNAARYRRQSLEIHGWLCAKCGMEFNEKNLHLLTVHHRDGNHKNNPPNGCNWENLCVHCHNDEHSREMLGNYLSDEK